MEVCLIIIHSNKLFRLTCVEAFLKLQNVRILHLSKGHVLNKSCIYMYAVGTV